MATINRFEDLEIWQEAREIAKASYSLSLIAYGNHDFELANALTKTSGSVMDNIAEGFGREGNREFVQFLSISKGSCAELKSQCIRFYDRPYIQEEDKSYILQIQKLYNRIGGLMKYIKQSNIKGHKFKELEIQIFRFERD
ncbi:MAG: four helix bundle protein [Flavobacteriales bacterium]|jgi:four helix bundle protein|nr:four helix bundle protein [Flavobacteriales bacterium]MBT3963750.1 four helix bundle protein [Flavobacteriales bacterium]MBT4704101.1 four helix bundle protein [Flavobacteriales bacterium]MBT4930748.1 four helix bundle protein [Flavobacteriales bacterium]MBT5132081.1 four helix bundle protein [Flavobacteriales bacterium]